MLQFPVERHQGDGKGDDYSAKDAIDFTNEKLLTRQEFAAEAEIKNMVEKFGLMVHSTNHIDGAVVDYTIDLQRALETIADAKRGWSTLSPELQAKYPTWTALLEAIEAGKYSTPEDDAKAAAAATETARQQRLQDLRDLAELEAASDIQRPTNTGVKRGPQDPGTNN